MEISQEFRIVIMLSNKGYVALENGQIFQLWKNKCLKDVYDELKLRYPSYTVSLGSLSCFDFNNVVEAYNLFNHKVKQPEIVGILEEVNTSKSKININFNKDLKAGKITMKNRNKAKVKAVAVIGINFTVGILHLGFQTLADSVCHAEAKIIDKMNVFDKTVEEIMNARRTKTYEAQQSLLRSPNRVKQSAGKFYYRIKELKDHAKVKTEEIIKTA